MQLDGAEVIVIGGGVTGLSAAWWLARSGADVIVLATNTMHKLASQMMHEVSIPFIHIGEATARAIRAKRL